MRDLVRFLEEKQNSKVYVVGRDGNLPKGDALKRWLEENQTAERHFLLVENALGLKYFAGALPTGEENYFAPILNLESKHAFYTKSQVEAVLQHAGVKGSFFYPYPDANHMDYLFSDWRGPKGDDALRENLRYDKKEYNLFAEGDVAKRLCEEGCFGTFANCFLVELNPTETISYVKFSDRRKKEFAIETILGEKDGKPYALKRPLYPEGDAHVRHLKEMEEALAKACETTSFRVCMGTEADGGLVYPYIEGNNYDALCDRALFENGKEACLSKISDFVEAVKQLPQKDGAFLYTDVDLVMSNVIVDATGQKWIIDAEWCRKDPIPVDFLVYRILRYYLYAKAERLQALTEEVFETFCISKEKKASFEKMEEDFQKSMKETTGEGAAENPIAEISDKRNANEILKTLTPAEAMDVRVKVYKDFGEGFKEENVEIFDGRSASAQGVKIVLDGTVKRLRIDPAECPGVLSIKRICDETGKEVVFRHNGICLNDCQTFFDSSDPWVEVKLFEGQKELYAEFAYDGIYSYDKDLSNLKKLLKENKVAKIKAKLNRR